MEYFFYQNAVSGGNFVPECTKYGIFSARFAQIIGKSAESNQVLKAMWLQLVLWVLAPKIAVFWAVEFFWNAKRACIKAIILDFFDNLGYGVIV